MNALFQDRRMAPIHRKKGQIRKELPQIKQSSVQIKKISQYLTQEDESIKIFPFYPILSNVLISRKINPPQPARVKTLLKDRDSDQLFLNFKLKDDSTPARRVKEILISKIQQKRCNTSLCQRESSSRLITEPPERRRPVRQGSRDVREADKLRKQPRQIKFSILGGNNNESLVREVLERRVGVREAGQGDGVADVKWVFSKGKHNFKKMGSFGRRQIVNHFQYNHQLCTKDALIKNLQFYCETKRIELFRITPVTFILDFDSQYCEFNLKQFLNFFVKNDARTVKSQYSSQLLSGMKSYMARQNPDIRKKGTTYCRTISSPSYYSSDNYLWLLKPTGLNRGRGIEIFNSLEQLQQKMLRHFQAMNRKSKSSDPNPRKLEQSNGAFRQEVSSRRNDSDESCEQIELVQQSVEEGLREDEEVDQSEVFFSGQAYQLNTCSFVVQKYVERPMLINNRKFDIRVWSLLTPNLQLFFFRQGYIRTACEQYSTGTLNNPFIHLTNNSIQKHSPTYGQFEEANQLPFDALKREIPEEEVANIWRRIKELTYMAFSSVKKKINHNNRKICFEIFGLDFMIDFQRKVWLIQVNQNPCLECTSPLLEKLIPKMLEGALELTVDKSLGCRKKDTSRQDCKGLWESLGKLSANCSYVPIK